MPFNSLGAYTPTHKTWDHVGNVVPVVEHSEGIRPHGEFKPAAWLPVQFYDKYAEEWYVVMPGKILSFDNQNRLVPAQYNLGGAQVTYTSDDVDAGVIDVRTGVTLVSSGVGTFNVSSVSNMMGTSEALAVSAPVGVAPYAYWQWAGDGAAGDDGFNPAHYRKHNHNLQHRTAILCDYVLELPLVPDVEASQALSSQSYNGGTDIVVFQALTKTPVAKNTTRTPITFANSGQTDASTVFVREVTSASDVDAAGDWHVDLTTGIVTAFRAAGDPGVSAYLITYYAYEDEATTVSKFACAVGNLKAGDFVKCVANSNFGEATPATDMVDALLGQVLEVEDVQGKDYLDRVRTAFDPAISTSATGTLPGTSGQLDQMPGSATGGVPDKVHYAGAANLVVRINLITR